MGGSLDRAQQTEYHPGEPVSQWLADALLECHPIARRIASKEPEECTREGYDITGLDAALGDALESECDGAEGMGLLGHLADARTWARAYGGGALVLFVDDGRAPSEPIDRTRIRRVNGIMSADRWELHPTQWAMDRREGLAIGTPRLYQFHMNRQGGASQTMAVHAHRVIRIRGLPLPRRLTQMRQGWDGSIFDLCFPSIRDRDTTLLQIAEAVRLLNQGVLTSPALNAAIDTGPGGADVFMNRLEMMRLFMGAYGEIGLGQGETYEIKNRSLAGLDAADRAASAALVAAADGMPRLVLLGEVTSGFSNASDGEMRAWYDQCAARQPKIYTPAVRRVIDLVMLSHEGPTGGQRVPYEVEWRPLYQLSESERADLDLKRAQRRQVDIAARVVAPEQAQREPSVVELYGAPEAPPPPMDTSEPLDSDAPLADAPDDQPEPEGVVSLVAAAPSTKPIPPDLLTPADAGEMIGVTSQKIRSWMRRGVLEYWGFDGDWRCSAADLAKMGQQHVV
jgi:phage-related protein (TIGR01555 family)